MLYETVGHTLHSDFLTEIFSPEEKGLFCQVVHLSQSKFLVVLLFGKQ